MNAIKNLFRENWTPMGFPHDTNSMEINAAYHCDISPVKIKLRVEKIRTKGFSADFIPLVPQ